MKNFSESDVTTGSNGFKYLFAEYYDLLRCPINSGHNVTGYGKKLSTDYKIMFEGRVYRVYCSIYSNAGTCYIITKGQKIIIN